MELFGRKWTKDEILRKVGDISQIGGIRLMELQEGNEKGVISLKCAPAADCVPLFY